MSYPSSAYNSCHFTPQPRPESKPSWSERIHRRGETFAYSQVNDSIATSAVRDQEPSIVSDKDTGDFYWNHQRLEPHTFVRWANIYILFATLAKGVLYFACPIGICISLIPLFGTGGLNVTVDILSIVALYIALPAALIYYPPRLWMRWCAPEPNKNNLSLFARKRYTLNRETGMVTLYGEKNRKIFTHPFIEFDCILASNPNHQGLLSYRLMLVHRYDDYGQGVNIGTLVGVNMPHAEYKRLWNMIQQYMDVSQPLPDIPMLEPFREQDPTTAAFDKQTGRNPHYWREMSDEEFEKKLTEMARIQREEDLPPTGPVLDIFAKAS